MGSSASAGPTHAQVRDATLAEWLASENCTPVNCSEMRLFESGPDLHAGADYEAWDAVLTEGIARRLGVDPLRDPTPRLVATVGFAVLTATVQSWGAAGGRTDLVGLLDDGFAALRRVTVGAEA